MTAGYSNANYKVTTTKGIYLLKIHLGGNLDTTVYETQLLHFLRQFDFPAAYPISNSDSEYITNSPAGTVVIYDFIDGGFPEAKAEHVILVSKAMAKLHSMKVPAELERKNELDWTGCTDFIPLFKQTKEASCQPYISYFLEEHPHYETVMQQLYPKGFIHGDLFFDNTILSNEDKLYFIDFEAAATDFLIIDVGVTINGFCFRDEKLDFSLLQLLLETYHQIRPLTANEAKHLSDFILWAIHSVLGWHIMALIQRGTDDKKRTKRIEELIARVHYLRSIQEEINGFVAGVIS